MGLESRSSEESNRLLGTQAPNESAAGEIFDQSPPYNSPALLPLQTANSTRININENEDVEEPRLCRICQSGESDSDDDDDDAASHDEEALVDGQIYHPRTASGTKYTKSNNVYRKNPLIKPCKCKGSMMYVHLDCLNRWRKESPRPASTYACDLCGYQYHLYRPMYANLIANAWFINITTAFIVVLIVAIAALLSFLIDIHALGNPPRRIEVYLACGIIATATIGLIIFMVRCATEGASSIAMPIWCCPDGIYPCYLGDCGAIGGGDAALAGLFVVVIVIAMTILIFGLVGAVSGVYILVESNVEQIAGKVKERILDVD